jgi:hypothetical protein
MNALDALKLAKETGEKVKPKCAIGIYYISFSNGHFHSYLFDVNRKKATYASYDTVKIGHLLDAKNNPQEWEIVT